MSLTSSGKKTELQLSELPTALLLLIAERLTIFAHCQLVRCAWRFQQALSASSIVRRADYLLTSSDCYRKLAKLDSPFLLQLLVRSLSLSKLQEQLQYTPAPRLSQLLLSLPEPKISAQRRLFRCRSPALLFEAKTGKQQFRIESFHRFCLDLIYEQQHELLREVLTNPNLRDVNGQALDRSTLQLSESHLLRTSAEVLDVLIEFRVMPQITHDCTFHRMSYEMQIAIHKKCPELVHYYPVLIGAATEFCAHSISIDIPIFVELSYYLDSAIAKGHYTFTKLGELAGLADRFVAYNNCGLEIPNNEPFPYCLRPLTVLYLAEYQRELSSLLITLFPELQKVLYQLLSIFSGDARFQTTGAWILVAPAHEIIPPASSASSSSASSSSASSSSASSSSASTLSVFEELWPPLTEKVLDWLEVDDYELLKRLGKANSKNFVAAIPAPARYNWLRALAQVSFLDWNFAAEYAEPSDLCSLLPYLDTKDIPVDQLPAKTPAFTKIYLRSKRERAASTSTVGTFTAGLKEDWETEFQRVKRARLSS